VRFADDFIVGFEHRDDAERFHSQLRDRLAQLGLELAAEKTRLVELGRSAAERRRERALGKPETFEFLGFTHICAKTRAGRFKLRRVTAKKRMRAKLRAVKAELRRRRHLPTPAQGALASQPAHAYVLGADEPSRRSLATARPRHASLARCAL
jgi:RNA-directed DNA polymerase